MLKSLLLPIISYKYLLSQLVLREIKGRYKQSILGYAWVLLSPLLQMLVLSFVFSMVFRFPLNNIPYPIFLFIGLLPWIYFQTSLATACTSLVDNSNLLKKVAFPREVIIYSVIIAKTLDFAFASILLIAFMLYYQTPLFPVGLCG